MKKVLVIFVMIFTVVMVSGVANASNLSDTQKAVILMGKNIDAVQTAINSGNNSKIASACQKMLDDTNHARSHLSRPSNVSRSKWQTFRKVLEYVSKGAAACETGAETKNPTTVEESGFYFKLAGEESQKIQGAFK